MKTKPKKKREKKYCRCDFMLTVVGNKPYLNIPDGVSEIIIFTGEKLTTIQLPTITP